MTADNTSPIGQQNDPSYNLKDTSSLHDTSSTPSASTNELKDQQTVQRNSSYVPQPFPAPDLESDGHGPDGDGYDDEIERIESVCSTLQRELSRSLTNSAPAAVINDQYDTPLPPMGLNKSIPTDYPDPDPYTVSFNGPEDPLHPHNWPMKKKLTAALVLAVSTCSVSFGSSVFSPAITTIAEEYHVGRTVATLGVSLYVLGFACGPVIWGPLSELFGRKPILLISCFGFTCFQFAVATGKDIQTILISRAMSGLIGTASFVIGPGAFADMFNNHQRGMAINLLALTIFMMPILAPIAGQFITSSYLGWRWTAYITGIMAAASVVLTIFLYEESHHPIILVNKAKEIKKRTGNWLIHAPHDEFELTLNDIVQKNITRPLAMLIQEPILLFVSIYNAFIYAILYMLLTAYPIVFEQGYGIKGGVGQLPYIGVTIGMFIGCGWNYYYEGKNQAAVKANGGRPAPEARLHPIFLASIIFPLGLLWFTWSGHYHEKVHWMVPTASGLFIGFGLFTIFTATLNYIIDAYLIFAASAIAANTFLRSGLACAFPLFSVQMFNNMGVNWAGLMLALFAFALVPVPILFFKYGKRLRARSKYTFDL